MITVTLKRVTIIGEAVLESHLIADLKRLGATGYTLSRVKGEGSRGMRASVLDGSNIKLESIVSEEVAHRVLEHLVKNYFEHYAVISYIENVEVVRGDKYV